MSTRNKKTSNHKGYVTHMNYGDFISVVCHRSTTKQIIVVHIRHIGVIAIVELLQVTYTYIASRHALVLNN